MKKILRIVKSSSIAVALFGVGFSVFADEGLNSLISAGKFREAINYAEEKLPPGDRDDDVWVKLAIANDAEGLSEKALACYLVAWRVNPNSYPALYGISKVYNKLSQPENAVTWAQKALDLNFTPEASWEYARASISLNRASEAKKALEKVIQADSTNEIANKELGKIYFDEKEWTRALPLLKKSFEKKSDPTVMYQIGKASLESNASDSAVHYLSKSMSNGGPQEAALELARAYFGIKRYEYALTSYKNVSSTQLSAEDLYKIAFSNEITTGTDVWKEYDAALVKFGNAKTPEALKSREKVGLHLLKTNEFAGAVKHFQFIVDSDGTGMVIPDGYVLLSDALKGSKNTKGAIAILEKAISINSKNVEAYVRLGDLYSFNGDAEKAKRTLETLIDLSPNDPAIYLKLGLSNSKAGKYNEAITHFEKSQSLKNSADAFAGIAFAQAKLGSNEKAVEAAIKALEIDAANNDANSVLAAIYFDRKDYRNAQKNLEYIVKAEPSNVTYLEKLATCYLNNGTPDKLYELDKKITEMSNKNVDSRMRLAMRADSLALVDSALIYFTQLAELTPTEPLVFNRLFKLSIKNKQRNFVTTYFGKYIALKPDDGEAFRDYGDYLYELKDLDNALVAYRKAIAINPSLKGFYTRYAEIVIAKGQEDEVVTALNRVIKNGEAELGTYTTLGMIYQKKKMYISAIEMYKKALKMDPTNFDVIISLASSQSLNGDNNEAVIYYEQAVMMNDKAVNEFKELGDTYTKLNRTAEAIKAYKRYIEKEPTDQKVLKILGEDAYVNKQYAAAVTYLGKPGLEAEEKYLIMYSEACIATEKYELAIAPLEKLRLDNKKLDGMQMQTVLKMLAQVYEKLGKTPNAISVYAGYLALPNVKDPEVAYTRASLILRTDTLAALKAYEENLNNYPADYRNFLKAGLLLAGKKESLEKSVNLLKRVTELASGVPEVWLELARAYEKLNRSAEALDSYMKYSESDPQNPEANDRIGTLLLQRGKINEGMVYLELANTLKPNDPEILMTLANGYLRTNRSTEAIALLDKAKGLKPNDIEISLQLFELYKTTKNNDKALAEIKALIESHSETQYLVRYADFLSEIGKQKEALKIIEEILAVEADNFDVLLLKAKFLRKEKKPGEAIEIYKEIGDILPDHIPTMFERAEAHLEESKPQWAETYYLRVLRLDPQFALAELGLAKIAKLYKNTTEYRARLEKAIAIDPNNEKIKEEWATQSKN